MVFNSFSFAVFLPIVFILYWIIPSKYRWGILLVSSYYFYMSWNAKYVLLILFTTAVSYTSAVAMERVKHKSKKKILLIATLVASLGVLLIFKYFQFFGNSMIAVLSKFSIELHPITLRLLLPVGISFYTFQTLSYVIDVYRGEVEAEHHFGKYATFISFFPQLVAGPIERTRNLLPQINGDHVFDYDKASYGLKLMAVGFFKKVVIADTLAIYVDRIYGSLRDYKGLSLIVASVLFSFQIYCDFSGYSDIAIGTAKLFGIDLMTNFKSPYFSASIREFWSRWHISLSTWFRDYVYIPLGGNRCSKFRHNFNLLITFLVSGLWHGANWTFVIWGGIHGLGQIVENGIGTNKKNRRVGSFGWWISVLVVFLFCTIAWVFFRASSVADVGYIFKNCFVGITSPASYIKAGYQDLNLTIKPFLRVAFIILLLLIYDFFSLKRDLLERVRKTPFAIRWGIYFAAVNFILIYYMLFGIDSSSFIYFQF